MIGDGRTLSDIFGWFDIAIGIVICFTITMGVLIFFSPLIASLLFMDFPGNAAVAIVYSCGFLIVARLAIRDYFEKKKSTDGVEITVKIRS